METETLNRISILPGVGTVVGLTGSFCYTCFLVYDLVKIIFQNMGKLVYLSLSVYTSYRLRQAQNECEGAWKGVEECAAEYQVSKEYHEKFKKLLNELRSDFFVNERDDKHRAGMQTLTEERFNEAIRNELKAGSEVVNLDTSLLDLPANLLDSDRIEIPPTTGTPVSCRSSSTSTPDSSIVRKLSFESSEKKRSSKRPSLVSTVSSRGRAVNPANSGRNRTYSAAEFSSAIGSATSGRRDTKLFFERLLLSTGKHDNNQLAVTRLARASSDSNTSASSQHQIVNETQIVEIVNETQMVENCNKIAKSLVDKAEDTIMTEYTKKNADHLKHYCTYEQLEKFVKRNKDKHDPILQRIEEISKEIAKTRAEIVNDVMEIAIGIIRAIPIIGGTVLSLNKYMQVHP